MTKLVLGAVRALAARQTETGDVASALIHLSWTLSEARYSYNERH